MREVAVSVPDSSVIVFLMRYVGSKRRIANKLRDHILDSTTDRHTYVEPFCGGLNSFQVIAPHFKTVIAADVHEDLIDMWKAFVDGWIPMDNVFEYDYYRLKNSPPSPDRTVAAIGSSFGSKWFGGFARSAYNRDNPDRTHHKGTARSLEKTRPVLESIKDLRLICSSYDALDIPDGAVVYCDPPYDGTLSYKNKFDHAPFWQWARDLSGRASVFVSEYKAPEDFACVLETPTTQQVDRRGSQDRVERLFKYTG